MLIGKYTHAIDAKNRIIIPSRLKEQLGPVITMLKAADHCLTLYSAEEWAKYTEKLSTLPTTQSRALLRYLYSNALEIQPDSQGRFSVPENMLTFAGIQKNVVTVGCGNYVEIWAAERWEENRLDEEPENFAAVLESLGL